ncbi:hypothetical protein ES705_31273 [subsurface metagenome]
MPAKTSDPRYERFAASYGNEVTELDALPPDVLESVIAQAIEADIDWDKWNKTLAETESEREEVKEKLSRLGFL